MEKSEEENLNSEQNTEVVIDDKETQCGLWCFKGPKIQWLASKKTVVVLYSIASMLCGAGYAYQTATVSTMEKQYKFTNKKIGVFIALTEITSILGSFFIPYYASVQGNLPRWSAVGFLMYVAAFLLNGLPYFIYGPGEDALANTWEYYSKIKIDDELNDINKFNDICYANKTITDQCGVNKAEYQGVSIILALSSILFGLAQSFLVTLNVTYIDNNVKKTKLPIILTLTTFIRLLAPLFGYSLASYCLKIYVEPSLSPKIDNTNPRWLGAWWIGWFIQAAVLLLITPFIAALPKTLPRQAERNREELLKAPLNLEGNPETAGNLTSLHELWETLKRLFTNKVLMCNNLAAVFYTFGYIPFFKYQAKYIEVQYLFSPSTASMIVGTVTLVFAALGYLASGVVISIFKPKARYLAGWNIIISILSIFGVLGYAFFGCSLNNNMEIIKTASSTSLCNRNCMCDYVRYEPICGINNATYVSACHAGCKTKNSFENGSINFENCDCVSNTQLPTNTPTPPDSAVNGPCPVDCWSQFYFFLVILCINKFLGGTESMANFLLGIRCVEKRDKAVSLGLSAAMVSLFALLPSPIFFGHIIDQTCILWGKTCAGTGNCWLYDTVSMRYNLNLFAGGFVLIGTLFDVGTFYYSKDVRIFDEEVEDEEKNEEQELKNLSGT